MTKPSEGWDKPVVLDDVELYHFATEGERKLAASLIRSSIEDMVLLKKVGTAERNLSRNVTVEELRVSREWVASNGGVLSFEECCNICAPDMDWRSVQQAILVDPEGALERIRNQNSVIVDNDVALPQTEAEIARGDEPITTGRLAMSLLHMIQGDLDFEPEEESVRPMAF
ncbi:hypothetical protein LJR175_008339 [Variovorax sp. LjRoot175]|uniref:hypothetical protein n=1 Tax=Variovorax sp. LjRoot175 TaxID=3342276 RepID=UPI003ECF946A